jgi:ribosome-associated toxin RatA of RatAB toxin-antitoxin module
MYFNKQISIFLQLLYFGLAIYFHKNIQTDSNVLCLNKKWSLYQSIVPDISHSKSLFDISLPYLNSQDKMVLATGEMIKKQERNKYRGTGLVVIDINSCPDVVFDTLTQFNRYQEIIPVVRSSKILSSDNVNVVTEFTLSKFLLRFNIKHTVVKDQRLVRFSLDSKRLNNVFKEAHGFWHVQIPEDRPEGYCRVYLSTEILAHKMVPTVILDYAASKALLRATTWLKPFFEKKDLTNEPF